MIFRFDPKRRLIPVTARIEGPSGVAEVLLALDTGASRTMLSPTHLAAVGCDVPTDAESIVVTTGSRREIMPLRKLPKLSALGHSLAEFTVLAHQLPSGAAASGLLGLDFFAGCRLELDFRAGTIRLEPPDA